MCRPINTSRMLNASSCRVAHLLGDLVGNKAGEKPDSMPSVSIANRPRPTWATRARRIAIDAQRAGRIVSERRLVVPAEQFRDVAEGRAGSLDEVEENRAVAGPANPHQMRKTRRPTMARPEIRCRSSCAFGRPPLEGDEADDQPVEETRRRVPYLFALLAAPAPSVIGVYFLSSSLAPSCRGSSCRRRWFSGTGPSPARCRPGLCAVCMALASSAGLVTAAGKLHSLPRFSAGPRS